MHHRNLSGNYESKGSANPDNNKPKAGPNAKNSASTPSTQSVGSKGNIAPVSPAANSKPAANASNKAPSSQTNQNTIVVSQSPQSTVNTATTFKFNNQSDKIAKLRITIAGNSPYILGQGNNPKEVSEGSLKNVSINGSATIDILGGNGTQVLATCAGAQKVMNGGSYTVLVTDVGNTVACEITQGINN